MPKHHANRALPGLFAALLLAGPAHADETAATGQPAAEAATAGQSAAEAAAPADPVAMVNGSPIPRSVFEAYAEQRRAQLNLPPAQADEVLKEELVVQELLVQEAEKQNLLEDPAVAAQLEMLRRNVLAAMALRRALEQQNPSEEDILAVYESLAGGARGQEYKARHILVESQDKAREVIGKLEADGDFAELAKAYSSDSSAAEGGDLGWFSPDVMVQPFGDAVKGLEKGQYTHEPVQTQFGWHVIQLDDSRPQEPPPLEALRPQITQQLRNQMVRDYIGTLRETAEVTIN